MRRRWLACSAIVAAVLATGCGGGGDGGPQAPSGDQAAGQDAFERSCATCHGQEARGTDTGPPLVDRIYEPSHHGDAAFQLAVRGGSPQHHWSFGDMPAVPDVSDQEIVDIVAYVRALQEAAGIR